MPKYILIFADGTDQIGGLKPDQRLSNVYKMYRAMRPGPSSPIAYNQQMAYYDPGLGAGEIESSTGKKVSNLLESALGSGIDNNMIDCYEKILSFYETGDRIVLIGFSRGAYTVRALANVMNLCGVPTHLPNGRPLPKTGKALRAIAKEAVISVYGHGSGRPRGAEPYFSQRESKGKRFRAKYGSTPPAERPDVQGNVQPYFIGVFDTVAALQDVVLANIIKAITLTSLILAAVSFLWSWPVIWKVLSILVLAAAFMIYVKTKLPKIRYYEPDPKNSLRLWNPLHWYKIYNNTHLAYWNKENYDRYLDPDVGFARHALSIDESRADFPRVEWAQPSAVLKNSGKSPTWLNQVWFAGCHSDVGGSYTETESRLSDIALDWLVRELKDCAPSIQIREDLLVRSPDPKGLQHEEVYLKKWWLLSIKWKRKPRVINKDFDLHPSVIERLKADAVPHPDVIKLYRPLQLKEHPQAAEYYNQ